MIKIVDKEYFIKICEESKTMAQAATKLNMHFNTFSRLAKKFGCYRPNPGGKGTHKEKSFIYTTEDILSGNKPHYQTFKLKNRLLKEGIFENKCSVCGLTEWLDKPLNMELHHLDGERTNHKLENLALICPNCHAQTETFRSKNKKNHVLKWLII